MRRRSGFHDALTPLEQRTDFIPRVSDRCATPVPARPAHPVIRQTGAKVRFTPLAQALPSEDGVQSGGGGAVMWQRTHPLPDEPPLRFTPDTSLRLLCSGVAGASGGECLARERLLPAAGV